VTLVSVEILELELMNVGTEKMELQFIRSGAYPLFDDVTISAFWVRAKKGQNDSRPSVFPTIQAMVSRYLPV
jgi:hypothetical protein